MIADLISVAARSVVVALVGLVAFIALRRSSAAVKHVVAITTLLGVFALPLLQLVVPKQYVPVQMMAPGASLSVAAAPLRQLHWTDLIVRDLPLLWAVGSALLLGRLAVGLFF